MKSKIIILFIVSLVKTDFVYTQVTTQWQAMYDTSSTNFSTPVDCIVDDSGNLLLCLSNSNDIALIKYDHNGNQIWLKRYDAGAFDQPNRMRLDKHGNIYITGESDGTGTGTDFVTIKIDSSGNQDWVKRYSSNGQRRDASYDLYLDSYGNVFVVGESYNNTNNTIDCMTIKYDSLGNQQCVRRFQSNSAIGYAIICDSFDDVFITGRSDGDIFTIKYSTDGVMLQVEMEFLNNYICKLNQKKFQNEREKTLLSRTENYYSQRTS